MNLHQFHSKIPKHFQHSCCQKRPNPMRSIVNTHVIDSKPLFNCIQLCCSIIFSGTNWRKNKAITTHLLIGRLHAMRHASKHFAPYPPIIFNTYLAIRCSPRPPRVCIHIIFTSKSWPCLQLLCWFDYLYGERLKFVTLLVVATLLLVFSSQRVGQQWSCGARGAVCCLCFDTSVGRDSLFTCCRTPKCAEPPRR